MITNKSTFLTVHSDSATQFSAVLDTCAAALGISRDCLHLFFEETGTTEAFNSNGSLFFNLRAWEEMGHGRREGEGRERAEIHWFVVFCHEVAHNLAQGHGTVHGFWTLVVAFLLPQSGSLSSLLSFGTLSRFPGSLPRLVLTMHDRIRESLIIKHIANLEQIRLLHSPSRSLSRPPSEMSSFSFSGPSRRIDSVGPNSAGKKRHAAIVELDDDLYDALPLTDWL
jgi:hypothetical protein